MSSVWQPIETAPMDGTRIVTYSPSYEGLAELFCVAAYHPDAGWCVDELRHPTHWQPIIESPQQ